MMKGGKRIEIKGVWLIRSGEERILKDSKWKERINGWERKEKERIKEGKGKKMEDKLKIVLSIKRIEVDELRCVKEEDVGRKIKLFLRKSLKIREGFISNWII